MPAVEERVTDLEQAIAELAHAQLRTEMSLRELSHEMKEFKEEMKDFKNEMKDFKNEMKDFKDEMKDFKDEMSGFKGEMLSFKDEMRAFKTEAERDRRAMNKAWGDLANKLGTIVEDIVAPNVRRLAVEEFGFARVEDFVLRPERVSRRGAAREAEFDVVCAGADRVIVAESKSSPSIEHIEKFAARIGEFFDFFPEYDGREMFAVFSSWSLAPRLCERISELGLYGIAMGDETMHIVARPIGRIP